MVCFTLHGPNCRGLPRRNPWVECFLTDMGTLHRFAPLAQVGDRKWGKDTLLYPQQKSTYPQKPANSKMTVFAWRILVNIFALPAHEFNSTEHFAWAFLYQHDWLTLYVHDYGLNNFFRWLSSGWEPSGHGEIVQNAEVTWKTWTAEIPGHFMDLGAPGLIKNAKLFFSFLILHVQTSKWISTCPRYQGLANLGWKINLMIYQKVWRFPTQNTKIGVFLRVSLRCPQVLNLFDEALEPPIRVAFEAPDADAEEDAHLAGSWLELGIQRFYPNDLVGGLEPWNFMTFHSVGNVIIPTDFHNFQRGWYTTNQTYSTAFYVIPLRFGMIWDIDRKRVLGFCVFFPGVLSFLLNGPDVLDCFGFFWKVVLVFGANAVVNVGWGKMGKWWNLWL